MSHAKRTALAVIALATGAASCATVRPWQREALARPGMSLAADDEAAAEEHMLESREGSAGGAGAVGGGCGCN